jgi:hypothetical protein
LGALGLGKSRNEEPWFYPEWQVWRVPLPIEGGPGWQGRCTPYGLLIPYVRFIKGYPFDCNTR